MIDFFRRLFRQPGSSATAKERLRLVLMTDHLELAPEMIESMKRDLVDVIGRYVEVDRDKIEVNFERQDHALAMLANIPIISVNRPSGNGHTNGDGAHVSAEAEAVETAPDAQEPAAAVELKAPPSRKRRKRAQKKAAAATAAPVPAS